MTAVMRALFQRLPEEQKYPLPPRLITMNLASKTGAAPHMDENARFTATMLAHYAYGAAAGAVFAAIPPRTKLDVVSRGVGFGLAVWTVSYLGLLPGVGLLSSATTHPVRRSGLMIAAHVVWGVALSVLEQVFRPTAQPKHGRTVSRSKQQVRPRSPRKTKGK
jgi:hypothetical protein